MKKKATETTQPQPPVYVESICGWYTTADLAPCVTCKTDTRGITEYATRVCYKCWHNIGHHEAVYICGSPYELRPPKGTPK